MNVSNFLACRQAIAHKYFTVTYARRCEQAKIEKPASKMNVFTCSSPICERSYGQMPVADLFGSRACPRPLVRGKKTLRITNDDVIVQNVCGGLEICSRTYHHLKFETNPRPSDVHNSPAVAEWR